MKLVEAYQAEDGSLHRDPSNAIEADRRYGLHQFVRRHGIGRGGPWDDGMIAETMVDHMDELAKLFQD